MSGRFPDSPVGRPVSLQRWEDLTFVHWAYRPAVVQRILPPGLQVQQWQGLTWVGVTPFRMADVRVPALPPPPAWRSFLELNVRVYVRGPDGRDGIWFPMLLAARKFFVAAMRTAGIRYFRSGAEAAIEGPMRSYRFTPAGRGPWRSPVLFAASVQVGDALSDHDRTPLVDSLTGRWGAYHHRGGVWWRTPVQHEPWPLRAAMVSGDLAAPLTAVGLPRPREAPLVHASGKAVHVRLGPPRPVGLSSSARRGPVSP